MSSRERLLLGLALLALGACPPPPPASRPTAAVEAECPEPPADLSPIEEVKQLSQEAREARANLMVRLERGEGLYATLHPPELALMEAALVQPAKARQLDPEWLRTHLLRATVEIYSPRPIEAFDGDLRQAVLVDAEGQRYPALTLGVRSDSQGWSYRFLLDPRPLRGGDEQLKVRFEVPGPGGRLEAGWSLNRRMLDKLEDQPIVFLLTRLRELRWARWSALLGDRRGARTAVEDLLACMPELEEGKRLLAALRAPPSSAAAEELELPPGPRPLAGDASQDAARELALRGALLGRLTEAFSIGLLRPEELAAAQQDLKQALAALGRSADEEVATALLGFDRRLAQLLAQGLDVAAPLASPRPVQALRWRGGPTLAEAEVDAELGRRLALANSGLLPQRTVLGAGPDRRLFEMRPLLEAELGGERLLAKPHLRLGKGYLHPGLPQLRYRMSLHDHGSEFWSAQAAAAKTPEALRALARRLLEQELTGPDEPSAALAMAGLCELSAEDGRRRLLPLVGAAAPRAASALRAMGLLGGQEARAALLAAARAGRPELREAAVAGLVRQGRAEDRPLVRAALGDADDRVALAAMVGLLRQRDAEALKRARSWLETDGPRGQALLKVAASRPGLPALGKELLRLLRGPASSKLLPAALARSLEAAAAAPLTRLYAEAPGLRPEILGAIAGAAFQPLLLKAAGEGDLELRRLALARLAELKAPPRAPFEEAAKQTEGRLRLVGNLGLARLGQAAALLTLAEAARGSCEDRELVLRPVAGALDRAGRGRLLGDALLSGCAELPARAWELIVEQHPDDPSLLRVGLSHPQRRYRVQAALLSLGLRTGAALGRLP